MNRIKLADHIRILNDLVYGLSQPKGHWNEDMQVKRYYKQALYMDSNNDYGECSNVNIPKLMRLKLYG